MPEKKPKGKKVQVKVNSKSAPKKTAAKKKAPAKSKPDHDEEELLEEEDLEMDEDFEAELEEADVPDEDEPMPGAIHAASAVPGGPSEDAPHSGNGDKPPKPPMRMYRVIAITFVVLVALALVAVLGISLHEATVRITPVSEQVSREFLVDVVNAPTRESEIRGRVIAASMSRSQAFEPSGEGVEEVPATATGTIIIRNDSGTAQPLIATTRFLTPDGVLLRIENDVRVPANGSVEAAAFADEDGASGNVGPEERLNIPGLSESRQQEVYGTIEEPFSGGVIKRAVITQEDIDSSAAELRDALASGVKDVLREELGEDLDGEAFQSSVVEQSADVAPGDEAEEYELTMTVKVVGAFFDRETLASVAERQLYEELQQGFAFVDIDTDGMELMLERFDVEEEMANMRIRVSGRSVPSATSDKLDPGRFTGIGPERVRTLLTEEGVAESVSVDISPGFMPVTPFLQDKIVVEIE